MRHLTWAKTTMRALIESAPSGTSDVRPYRPLLPSPSLSLCVFLPPSLDARAVQDREAAVLMWKTSVPATSDCSSISALPATATATATCASFVCYLFTALSLSLHMCVCVCGQRMRVPQQQMPLAKYEYACGRGRCGGRGTAGAWQGRGKRKRGGGTVRTINKFARCRVAKQLLMPCGSW